MLFNKNHSIFFKLQSRYTIHELLWAINCIIIIWPWSSPMILIDLIIFIFFCVYLVLNTFKIKELHLFERNSDLNFFCLDLFDLTSGIPYFWLSVVSKKMFKISSSNKDVYEREQLIKICQYFFWTSYLITFTSLFFIVFQHSFLDTVQDIFIKPWTKTHTCIG